MILKFQNSLNSSFLLSIISLFFCFSQLQAQSKKINQADSLLRIGQFEKAAKFYELEINSTKDSALLAAAYIGLAKSELVRSKFDLALKNYINAEKFTNNRNQQNLQEIYTGIGVVHSKLKNFEKAEVYFKKALNQITSENIFALKVYINLAGLYVETNNAEALSTYQKSLKLAKKLNRKDIQAVVLNNLSNYYIEQKSWDLARSNAKESLEIREELQMQNSVISYNNYGYALVQLGQIDEGITAYKKALPSASLQEKERLLLNMMNAYKEAGNYKESLEFSQQYNAVKDSIAANRYREKIAKIQTAYETEKNEKKIALLETENTHKKREFQQLIIGGVILLVLLLVIILLYLKNQKVKQKLAKSKLKQQLLQVQLNPHFLFNALQQIQFYIFNNEKENSMEYLANFSRLIRLVLETSSSEFIALSEEVEMLKKYLYLQQSAASKTFKYFIKLNIETDSSELQIPVMLLQPFVENAVLHGIKDHENGEIYISFEEDLASKKVIAEIKDNGKGIQQSKKINSQRLHTSMGSAILNERVEEYNKTHSRKIKLQIEEVEKSNENRGTRIIIEMPYRLA
ncbi:tetratricopeptide repeat-containing sensor histidine kinase [Zunongwangia sp. HGR-M22]|uniref:tetratricopeptide repeat-containing sensor histidine kinase n=1 Tax=Zunongwangia sp. HGR-M22 TaxID=3015168 RepID=UPI0022DD970B|nr:tetratricopeptide repeat protein [Zunongwangia sp. HGR-M22]WBL24537.1 tetratricopeptide repeat protein [Zunongwangia sp. HGR-M22]